MSEIIESIRKRLFEFQDLKYRDFQSKLMPDIDIKNIIGVRTPVVRSIAKEFLKDDRIDGFFEDLPHKYYDENNLHGFLICGCKDYGRVIKLLDAFLPYVDNWATCDLLSPKIFCKHKDLLIKDIERWIKSGKTFTVRFGIEMLMSHFLDGDFDSKYLKKVADIKSDEYYINMMIAWYFATALTKQWDAAIGYIEQNKLGVWVHNKTIQKCIESYRISDEQKEYLRSMKRFIRN